jgi:hypothetical protein
MEIAKQHDLLQFGYEDEGLVMAASVSRFGL